MLANILSEPSYIVYGNVTVTKDADFCRIL
jgi:hypothetical protein